MPPVLRSVLAVLAGIAAGVIVVAVVDTLVFRLYPLPAGTDTSDPAALRDAVATMPLQAFVLLLAGWVLAALASSWVAARLATRRLVLHGAIGGGLLLAATLANLAAVPHPTWMWAAAVVLLPVAVVMGIKAGARGRAE